MRPISGRTPTLRHYYPAGSSLPAILFHALVDCLPRRLASVATLRRPIRSVPFFHVSARTRVNINDDLTGDRLLFIRNNRNIVFEMCYTLF